MSCNFAYFHLLVESVVKPDEVLVRMESHCTVDAPFGTPTGVLGWTLISRTPDRGVAVTARR